MAVTTESISCNNCGGPLEIPESANFVTCNHCSSNLAVRRNDSVTFTEQVEKLGAQQTEMLGRLERIERQNRVAEIDRNWERERQKYMIVDKHGNKHEPGLDVGSTFAICFGILFAVVAGFVNFMFFFFGVIVVMIGAATQSWNAKNLEEYHEAYQRYRKRRKEALRS